MIHIGVIGIGSMGNTHLEAYANIPGCRVVAVADIDEGRRTGRTAVGGNIEGQGGKGFDFSGVRQYATAGELLADAEDDLVDVCVPTPLHAEMGLAALEAGKHLMVEKPLSRTFAEAEKLADAAEASDRTVMCGMCMRFWPGWVWLKEAIDDGRFGKVRSAHFRRVTSHPGGSFYGSGEASGGALLDLHVHDTDYVRWVFGTPQAVFSRGYSKITDRPDHVSTQYLYGEGGPMVSAEGGWAMTEGFGFEMHFTVNFENATAVFDLGRDPVLRLTDADGSRAVELPEGMGYDHELAYLIRCINEGRKPETVTFRDAAESLRIVEAEARSIASGRIEPSPESP